MDVLVVLALDLQLQTQVTQRSSFVSQRIAPPAHTDTTYCQGLGYCLLPLQQSAWTMSQQQYG